MLKILLFFLAVMPAFAQFPDKSHLCDGYGSLHWLGDAKAVNAMFDSIGIVQRRLDKPKGEYIFVHTGLLDRKGTKTVAVTINASRGGVTGIVEEFPLNDDSRTATQELMKKLGAIRTDSDDDEDDAYYSLQCPDKEILIWITKEGRRLQIHYSLNEVKK